MARHYITLIAILLGLGACSGSPDAEYEYLIAQFGRAESVQPISQDLARSEWTAQVADMFWDNPANPNVVIKVGGASGRLVAISYSDEPEPRQLSELIEGSAPVEVRLGDKMLYVHWKDTRSGAHYLLAYDLRGRKVRTNREVDPSDVSIKNPEDGAG